jgi:hypothetical protein
MLREKPWLLIVALLALFLTAWGVFLAIAFSNPPVTVPR